MDRYLARWLAAVRSHALVAHGIGAAVMVVGANLLARRVLRHDLGLGGAVALEFLIVAVAVALPLGATALALRKQIGAIVGLIREVPPPATGIVLRFVREEVRALEMRMADLRTIGVDFSTGAVSKWVSDRCFASASGAYVGTDVLAPSSFIQSYESYVQAQAAYMRRTRTRSVRINVAGVDDLLLDRRTNPASWAQYVDLHAKSDIALLYCDREQASTLAAAHGLGDILDLAFWSGELVLLVEYDTRGRARIRVGLAPESWYKRSADFLHELADVARPFSSLGKGLRR